MRRRSPRTTGAGLLLLYWREAYVAKVQSVERLDSSQANIGNGVETGTACGA